MKTLSLHRQSGLNLVEILVAALILSVGLLSLAGLQVASLKSTQGATHKQQASFMIHELFERMRSNRAGALAGAYNTGDDGIAINCSYAVGTDCGDATACSTAQLAEYDLHSVQCGSNAIGSVSSGTGVQVIDGEFEVECAAAGCTTGVVVSFSWAERLSDKDIQVIDGEGNEVDLETQTMTINATI
uniref:Type IV pilus modification protein PilV n=1 Tax=uncultured Thiotrichaceae bacterium TaxID=298394 RepID=A0A6S6UGL1_9GAMM|nr:MAG: Type IV pilus modification protein PilV [uncultured Thiotrichaceae bacterium]